MNQPTDGPAQRPGGGTTDQPATQPTTQPTGRAAAQADNNVAENDANGSAGRSASQADRWLYDLDALHDFAWRHLQRAAADHKATLRNIQVGTVTASGGPAVRTVVLRAASRHAATLTFYTDARSDKMAALQRDQALTIHGYDDRLKLQLRADGLARLQAGAQAQTAWERLGAGARAPFVQTTPPGTPLDDPSRVEGADPAAMQAAPASFVRVTTVLDRLEVLVLARAGHRRARFTYTPSSTDRRTGDAQWLAP